MLHDLRTWEISILQNGRDFVQEASEALVPFGYHVPFVATRQTTAEEPGYSARFHTVRHSNKKRGAAGTFWASDWTRRSWWFRWGVLVQASEQIYHFDMMIMMIILTLVCTFYRCEKTSGLPRLNASGVARWRLPYRRRHPRRSGHFHVRGDKTNMVLPVSKEHLLSAWQLLTSTCFRVTILQHLRCLSRCGVCQSSRTFRWE